ncbi:MAG: DNA mismatch repair protein MutS [Flavobacteriales bacterium]|nr:MAG: DNA mismatch repair protein MutS [Flavobacteriales bacterium]
MKQYNGIKAKYPDAMLLFRVGDFYETFGQDAIKAANILGITLTARNNGGSKLELAGFPYHSLNTYLPKLVRSGLRVAICDQLEAPSKEKKIVKRGVTELVTPGVTLNDQILDHKSNNFLAAVHFDKNKCGVAFLDVSTGEFLVGEGSIEYIDKLLSGFKPTEVLFQRNKQKQFAENFGNQYYTFCLDDWAFTEDFGNEILQKQFDTSSLKGYGIDDLDCAICAAGAALHYLSDTQHNKTKHITTVSRIEEDRYVWLDRFTIRNLELIYSPHENAKTLIDVLDHTISPMGSRLLKRWVALPLKDIQPINDRLDAVSEFVSNDELSRDVSSNINEVGDLERLISKVATARINPREVVQLKRALTVIEPVKNLCSSSKNEALNKIGERLNPCELIKEKIASIIQDDPPVAVQKGNVVKDGVSKELDDLRQILNSGKDALVAIQEREIENTGIPSLKIGFNNVFGYYIEIRNTHKDKVPEDWHRKQTLTQAERYITEELKEYESKILGADEKILQLETQIFNNLVLELADYIVPIQLNAALIAQLDCLLSFSTLANEHHYIRPEINDSKVIDIKDGRHPVIEQQLAIGDEYVANDVYLDDSTQQIIMITGPNMSGKSALLRQTALITLMAQIGCFVPAKNAKIGIVDKIFTRVGASDNISQGESTFMVEMNETASILNNLSDRCLILLDEIGRGTSTYDGISIAWSIAEYLHEHPKAKAKTLFATHYHELNDMTNVFKRIKNYNVSVKEIKNKIIFLRKLVQGGSNHSFGIHVAKMAGMPNKMIARANEVLKQLENSHVGSNSAKKVKTEIDVDDMQLSFFQLDDPILEQIKEELINIDINTLTPVEALMKLNEIKRSVGG